jgi:hypothetical protein
MNVFVSFTDTITRYRDRKISPAAMLEAFFVFNCHEKHLFPDNAVFAPYEITWGASNQVFLLDTADETGQLITATLPPLQIAALIEFRATIMKAMTVGRVVFMKSATMAEKLHVAYKLAVALGMRVTKDGSAWPDTRVHNHKAVLGKSVAFTTGYIPKPGSKEAIEMLTSGPNELEEDERALEDVIRRMAQDANDPMVVEELKNHLRAAEGYSPASG